MPLNITIDNVRSAHGSVRSTPSLSDGEGSNGTGVPISPQSNSGSQEYSDTSEAQEGWATLRYPDEIQPSDSASRPRSSHRHRPPEPRANSGSRPSRRHTVREGEPLAYRTREALPEPPRSVEPAEEFVGHYRPAPAQRQSFYGGPNVGYAHSSSSGASYAPYPSVGLPPSSQLVHYPPPQPATYAPSYHPPPTHMGPPHPPHHPGYFSPPHHHPAPQPLPSHVHSPYGGSPYGPHDVMAYQTNPGYFPQYPPMQYPMPPAAMFNPYARMHSPAKSQIEEKEKEKESPQVDPEETFKRFEAILLSEKQERLDREAAKEAEIKAAEQAAKAAEERAASDKKIAEEAAAKATAAALAEAEKKAAEEAAKAKQALEDAAAAAEADKAAAVAAAAPAPPPEKKAPIKFKDAVGRKFSFPFHLCAKWQGMEELIRQAFMHVEVIGPHVAEGHYDLVGPNGDIILPQVWETVIEPDWTITMHMWPMPEKPKTPDIPPVNDDDILILDDVLKPSRSGGGKGKAGAQIPVPPPPSPPLPKFRGGLPPIAPDAPKINSGSKKPGAAKPKQKPGGFAAWLNGGRPQPKGPAKAIAKTKTKK
ncbi:MAG: hypothetical protein Q9227_006013 [Pyrenula ochraceoflavens]